VQIIYKNEKIFRKRPDSSKRISSPLEPEQRLFLPI
jgi:hypothetical protein